MNRLISIAEKILRDYKQKTGWRIFASVMACVIVFTTTYGLILPAITMDEEYAQEMPGFDLEPGIGAASEEYEEDGLFEDDAFADAEDEILVDGSDDFQGEDFLMEDAFENDQASDVSDAFDNNGNNGLEDEFLIDGIIDDTNIDQLTDDNELENDPDGISGIFEQTSEIKTEDDETTFEYTIRELNADSKNIFCSENAFENVEAFINMKAYLSFTENARIPDGTQLLVSQIREYDDPSVVTSDYELNPAEIAYLQGHDHEYYKEAAFRKMEQILPDWNITDVLVYRMDLMKDELQIYPEDLVSVRMDFDPALNASDVMILSSEVNNAEENNADLIDFTAEEIRSLTRNDAGEITSVLFDTNTIGVFAVMIHNNEESEVITDEIMEEPETIAVENEMIEVETEHITETETEIITETETETEIETETAVLLVDDVWNQAEDINLEDITSDDINETLPEIETTEAEEEMTVAGETSEEMTEMLVEATEFYSYSEEVTEAVTEEIEEATEFAVDEYEEVTEAFTEELITETETETELIEYPSQSFSEDTRLVSVQVEAEEGAFPEGTTMTVRDVWNRDTLDAISDAAVEASENEVEVAKVQAVDITFRNPEGNEIQPARPITVTMIPRKTEDIPEDAKAVVVHVEENEEAEEPAALSIVEADMAVDKNETTVPDQTEEMEQDADDIRSTDIETPVSDAEDVSHAVVFEADAFSIYAVVYTVDFHWEVDGKEYEYTLPGGGFISLRSLVEALGTASARVQDTETGSDENAVDEFVAGVEEITFSSPELLWIGYVENETTVGELKEDNSLEIEYSSDLSDEKIAEINAQTVNAGDWALISLLPFDTEETLTVSMKTGEVFTIQVTDAQIKKTVISASGDAYVITVTYDETAGIPEGAWLEAEEILPENEDEVLKDDENEEISLFDEYVSKTENALGWEEGSVSYIRLFDIKILDENGEKVIIQAPVDVKIELSDKENDQETQVVHFADDAQTGDVVENVDIDGKTLGFEAEGFSVYAIVEEQEPVVFGERKVKDLEELAGNYNDEEGFYLSYGSPPKYFTNGLKSGGCYIETDILTEADLWYFEAVSGSSDTYLVYTTKNDIKYYMQNTSGNEMGLTTSAASAVVFELSEFGDYKFYFNKKGSNLYLQHSNGGGGIRLYAAQNNNGQISITYASSMEPKDDPYDLDGKTYGIAYHDDAVTSAALTSEQITVGNQSRLAAQNMLMRPDVLDHEGILLVAEGSDIQQWTFHAIEKDKYYITTEVDGVTKYLTVNGSNVTLENEPNSTASVITATPGTAANSGKWHLTVNGYSLNSVSNGFNAQTGSAATTWMNLVEKSVLNEDDFTKYTAKKVSVSDENNVYDGQQVVIYTRIWNETKKKYEFFAVDHDGSLIPCYDVGDNIEWIGSQVNTALWNFTEGTNSDGTLSYYYWLENAQYSNNFIKPQVSENAVIYTSTTGTGNQDFNASVNLNGRKYGRNFTTIICWDDDQYSYSGLKVENGHVVPCALADAQDFYFAVVNPIDETDEVSEVATVDNNDYGITMKMVDFNNVIQNASGAAANNTNGRDSGQTEVLGYDTNKAGLLQTALEENGYPLTNPDNTGKASASLADLYGTDNTDVNHLFIKSIYNESGYFEFDSTQNFAHLNDDNTFTVYDQLGAIGDYPGQTGTGRHGQFMPYDEITEGKYCTFTNETNVLGHELPDSDPRKGEELYNLGTRAQVHYFFGMEMEAGFTQTASGLDAWGHDIIFEFSGDDDFWLYVDGELVLDLGGVHSAMTGSINFRTGEVVSGRKIKLKTAAGTVEKTNYTLREVYESNYRTRHPEATNDEVAGYLSEYFEDGSTVFKDYTKHTMKMFYMERGGGASNLHMRFNLASVLPGTVVLSKKLSGTDSASNALIEFPYQIYYRSTSDGGTEYHLLEKKTDDTFNVTYKDTVTSVPYEDSFIPAGGTDEYAYSNVFFLKAGESAVINLPEDTIDYYIVECGINPDVYDVVKANGTELEGTEPEKLAGTVVRKDYRIEAAAMEDRPEVAYDNHVKEGAMRNLYISKKLYDVDGTTELRYPDCQSLFSFRLCLGNENADADQLPPADLYSYCIKDPDGLYCMWNAGTKAFEKVGSGISEFEELLQYFTDNNWTNAQKEKVIFPTSMNGSVSKIPAGYTVEIRDLVIGTQYKVEERDSEIPKGYTRREADGYTRVDVDPEDTNQNEAGVSQPYANTIKTNETPKIEVRNQVGWGLTVEKVWTDKDFMETHDDIFFAVYLSKEAAETDEDILLTDKVIRMKTDESEIYYFFDDLKYNGKTYQFTDFLVREVTVTPSEGQELIINDDGKVTISEGVRVIPISGEEGNNTLTIGGKPVGGTHQSGYVYTVSYDVGDTTHQNENIRTDTVTNSRPGIKLYKCNWTGEWNEGTLAGALPGAVFTLKDSNGNDVAAESYTSGADGLITIAYLNEGTYTLTEIETPNGYAVLDNPLQITIDENGAVGVSGVDSSMYMLDCSTDTSMSATITIKNRSSELLVKKIDEKTKEPLENVHFALYPQVTDNQGNKRKDYLPMDGYEDIVSDSDGFLPDITAGLGKGTYYLTETHTIDGYSLLSEDICFTIGNNGTVTLNNGEATGSTVETEYKANGQITYLITIPNYELGITLKKVDDNNRSLAGAKFSLCRKTDSGVWESVAGYAEIDMTTTSIAVFSGLEDGLYQLTETKAPDGYIILQSAVYFQIENGAVTLTNEDGTTPVINNNASLTIENSQNNTGYETVTISVINTPGAALPATGGPGTRMFYLAGFLLIAVAGVFLVMQRRKEGWS